MTLRRRPAHRRPRTLGSALRTAGRSTMVRLTAVSALVAVLAATLTTLSSASAPSIAAGTASAAAIPSTPPYSIWSSSTAPRSGPSSDTRGVKLGVAFTSTASGWITGVRYYRTAGNAGPHNGYLYGPQGQLLARTAFTSESATGWQTVRFSTPVAVRANTTYTAAYSVPAGRYVFDTDVFVNGRTITTKALKALRGVYTFTPSVVPQSASRGSNYYVDVLFVQNGGGPTTAPPPTTTAPPPTTPAPPTTPSGTWPNAANTGVPNGTTLSSYSGPCTITDDNTVINARSISCPLLVIEASNVVVSNSRLQRIDVDSSGASATVRDSELNGGTSDSSTVGYRNITLLRSEVKGGRVSVNCGTNCVIKDSWLHGQYLAPGTDWHNNAYISNGGSNVVVEHNTIACDVANNSSGGGCTGPVAFFGDFEPIRNVTLHNNYLVSSRDGAYCLFAGYDPAKRHGGNPTNAVYTNNVFERGASGKCAYYGAVTAYRAGSGNVFSGNRWDNGDALNV